MRKTLGLIGLIALMAGCSAELENKREDQVGETVVGQSIARAKDEKCMQALRQIRQMVELARTSGEDTVPASLQEMKIAAEMQACPIGKEPYEYDATTGTVKCKHAGHEEY